MPKRYRPEDLDGPLKELEGESVRAAITVGASLVEYGLELLIEAHLREPQTDAEKAILFTDNGIVGTFWEKIWLAYFLRLIGPQTRRDIDLIRSIRNEAAHNPSPISFDTPEIAGRCRELELGKQTIAGQQTPPNLRGMFLGTVHLLAAALITAAAGKLEPRFEEAAVHLQRTFLDR